MATIAFIGLGNMGAPMAGNLVKKGHIVRGADLATANLDAASRRGVTPCTSAAEAAQGADVVFTMLPAGKDTLAVYGKSGIFDAVGKGTLFVDCSTIDVASARAAP